MKLDIEKFRVKPGDKVDLAAISTKADPKADKNEVENTLFPALKNHLESLQEKLWAENKQSIILVLQGMTRRGRTAPCVTFLRKSTRPACGSRPSRLRP